MLIPGMLILRLLPGLCILSHIKMPSSGSKPTQLCRVHWEMSGTVFGYLRSATDI